jgi:hypothetical protein
MSTAGAPVAAPIGRVRGWAALGLALAHARPAASASPQNSDAENKPGAGARRQTRYFD